MGEDWNNILMYFFFNFILLVLHSVLNVYVWWWIHLYEMYICLVLTNSCIRVLIATTSKSVCKNNTKKYLFQNWQSLKLRRCSQCILMNRNSKILQECMIPIDFFKPVSSFIVSYLSQIICEVRFLFCRYKYIVILLPSINKFSLCVVYKFFIQFGK